MAGQIPLLAKALFSPIFPMWANALFCPMPSFGPILLFWPMHSFGHCPLLANSCLGQFFTLLADALFWPMPSFGKLLNPCNVVAQQVTSQPVTVDTTVTFLLTHRRLGPKSDIVKTARLIHSAQRTFTRFAWFPILALQRSRLSWNCGIDLFLVLRYWDIEWRWHLLKKLRC